MMEADGTVYLSDYFVTQDLVVGWMMDGLEV
jgi:hypothetical protein